MNLSRGHRFDVGESWVGSILSVSTMDFKCSLVVENSVSPLR